MKKVLIIILFLVSFSFVSAQETKSDLGELEKIYEGLEYNTIAFDDLKNKWFISDPGFVRELFNKFAVKNAFRINGQPADVETVLNTANEVFNGNVIVDLRRRYYDNQFEYFAFISAEEAQKLKPKPLFDPIVDGYYLQDIIGKRLYDKMQEQSYFFADVTKDEFESKHGYYFDLNIDALDSEVMFWSTTSNARNKYLLSFIGKYGFDDIFVPGWFYSNYNIGGQLTYYNALGDDPDKYTYQIALGFGVDASTPFTKDLARYPMYKTGENIYFKFSGDIFKYVSKSLKNLYTTVEGTFTYSDYDPNVYGVKRTGTRFVGIKNHVSVNFQYNDIFNMFDFGMFNAGLTLSAHDLYFYQSNATTGTSTPFLKYEDLDQLETYVIGSIGVEKKGGLVQHSIKAVVGYNNSSDYMYGGIQARVMISNTFGLDIRTYNNLNLNLKKTKNLWRTDYIVFSPIIRINY